MAKASPPPWPARTRPRPRSVPTAGHRSRIGRGAARPAPHINPTDGARHAESRRTVVPSAPRRDDPVRLRSITRCANPGKIAAILLASISSQHLESHRGSNGYPLNRFTQFESCSSTEGNSRAPNKNIRFFHTDRTKSLRNKFQVGGHFFVPDLTLQKFLHFCSDEPTLKNRLPDDRGRGPPP